MYASWWHVHNHVECIEVGGMYTRMWNVCKQVACTQACEMYASRWHAYKLVAIGKFVTSFTCKAEVRGRWQCRAWQVVVSYVGGGSVVRDRWQRRTWQVTVVSLGDNFNRPESYCMPLPCAACQYRALHTTLVHHMPLPSYKSHHLEPHATTVHHI